MRTFKTLKRYVNNLGETSTEKRDALLVLADIEELIELSREDVHTDAWEYAERVTRIKNIVRTL